MKRPKLDWEKRNEDDLMRKRGTVNVWDDPQPIKTVLIRTLLKDPNFPHSALGKTVKTKAFTGTVVEILEDGLRIKIKGPKNTTKIFDVDLLRKAEEPKQPIKRQARKQSS
jgi:hypothetical protein